MEKGPPGLNRVALFIRPMATSAVPTYLDKYSRNEWPNVRMEASSRHSVQIVGTVLPMFRMQVPVQVLAILVQVALVLVAIHAIFVQVSAVMIDVPLVLVSIGAVLIQIALVLVDVPLVLIAV